MIYLKKKLKKSQKKRHMIEKKLINNAKKIDKFLVSFLNNQKQS